MDAKYAIENFDITDDDYFKEIREYGYKLKGKNVSFQEKSRYYEMLNAVCVLISEQIDTMDNDELESFRKYAIERQKYFDKYLMSNNQITNDNSAIRKEIDLVNNGSLDDSLVRKLVTKWLKLYFVNKTGYYPMLENYNSKVFNPSYDIKYLDDEERSIGEIPLTSSIISTISDIEKDSIATRKKYWNGNLKIQIPDALNNNKVQLFKNIYGVEKNIRDSDHVFGELGDSSGNTLYVSIGFSKPETYSIRKLDSELKELKEKVSVEVSDIQSEFTIEKMSPLITSNNVEVDLLDFIDAYKDKISNADSIREKVIVLNSDITKLNRKLVKTSDVKAKIKSIKEQLEDIRASVLKEVRDWYFKRQKINAVGFEGKGSSLFENIDSLNDYLDSRNKVLTSIVDFEDIIKMMYKKVDEVVDKRQSELDEVYQRSISLLDGFDFSDQEKAEIVLYAMDKSKSYRTDSYLSERLPEILRQKNIQDMIQKKVNDIHKKDDDLSEMLYNVDEINEEFLEDCVVNSMK